MKNDNGWWLFLSIHFILLPITSWSTENQNPVTVSDSQSSQSENDDWVFGIPAPEHEVSVECQECEQVQHMIKLQSLNTRLPQSQPTKTDLTLDEIKTEKIELNNELNEAMVELNFMRRREVVWRNRLEKIHHQLPLNVQNLQFLNKQLRETELHIAALTAYVLDMEMEMVAFGKLEERIQHSAELAQKQAAINKP